MVGWALALEAACGLWLVAGHGVGLRALAPFLCFFALIGLGGLRYLREVRKPFRLEIDAWGVRLHDAELSWAQIEQIGLEYPPGGSPEGGPGDDPVPEPRLVLWPAPAVELPRAADRAYGGRRYTLVDTADLDQPLSRLTDAIRRFGGSRMKRLPAGLMADRPSGTTRTAADADAPTGAIDAAGSGHPVRPGLPREFTATGGNATRFTVGLVAALTFTLLVVDYLRSGDAPVPGPFMALAPLAGLVSWGYTGRAYLHWTRPRRLLVGPEGLTAREAGGTGTVFDWPGIAAVTVATRPADEHPWPLVWAEPGRVFTRDRSYVHDGQEVYRVIRLDRLPGGAETVVPAVREWSTGRFGWLPEK